MSESAPVSGPMTAVVEFRIAPEQMAMSDWLDIWRKRADDALTGEPATTGFEAAINVEDPASVLVWERYTNGDEGLRVHCERPSHAAIGAEIGARGLTMERPFIAKFEDLPGYGWWSRPERESTMSAAGIHLVLVGMNFADESARNRFIELSSGHADYCREAEPDTLVYGAGLSRADATFGIEIEADLVFAMACADVAAMEKHRGDPRHTALGEKLATAAAMPEIAFTRTYRTTGDGFLWACKS